MSGGGEFAVTRAGSFATGRGIRRVRMLRKRHGGRRWRKMKGDATVRLVSGTLRRAEIHWYEAHGGAIGADITATNLCACSFASSLARPHVNDSSVQSQ